MKIGKTALAAAIAAAVCACSAPQQRTVKPSSAGQAQSLQKMLSEIAVARAELSSPGMAAMPVLEPALCARLAGSGAPKFDAQELSCIVSWMHEAQNYLAEGGAPTKYTNQEEFDVQKKTALRMLEAQTKWLRDAHFAADAAPAVPVQNPAARSQNLYLEGMIAFQKGDNAKAREDWTAALKADPSNSDAQAGLDLLDKRAGQ